MNNFTKILEDIGIPVATDKTLGPTTLLEYLGLTLDFALQIIGIPEKKCKKCQKHLDYLLEIYRVKRKITVKSVQKLARSLNFITQALLASRPFLCSLYRLTRDRSSQGVNLATNCFMLLGQKQLCSQTKSQILLSLYC